MIEVGKLIHLQGAIVWLPCTIVLYAGSSALYRRLNKAPIANPTLLTIAALVLILGGCGIPYNTYFESVAVLHYLLGTAVVALALPLYRNASRLQGRYISMALALIAEMRTLALFPLLLAISPSRIRICLVILFFQPSFASKNLRSISSGMIFPASQVSHPKTISRRPRLSNETRHRNLDVLASPSGGFVLSSVITALRASPECC